MAKGWKKAVEGLLSRSGAAALVERRRRPQTVILAYHNIVPWGERVAGDLSLHIEQSDFGDHLDWLLERRRIVALEDAMRARDRGEPLDAGELSDTGEIVITFDDAYRGTMTAGLEELSKRGLSSTVFVPPGLLGSDGFWWDRVAPAGGRPLHPDVRRHALEGLTGRTPEVLAWARTEGLPIQDLPDYARPVTEDELLSSLGSGVTFGAHTWTHPNLTRLDEDDICRELRSSREWLMERTDRYRDWLAYPYGMVDDACEAVAEDQFDGALLVAGGAAVVKGRPVGSAHRVPRINVPRGLSLDGLALRLAGIR